MTTSPGAARRASLQQAADTGGAGARAAIRLATQGDAGDVVVLLRARCYMTRTHIAGRAQVTQSVASARRRRQRSRRRRVASSRHRRAARRRSGAAGEGLKRARCVIAGACAVCCAAGVTRRHVQARLNALGAAARAKVHVKQGQRVQQFRYVRVCLADLTQSKIAHARLRRAKRRRNAQSSRSSACIVSWIFTHAQLARK
jgi:hypothetical protein